MKDLRGPVRIMLFVLALALVLLCGCAAPGANEPPADAVPAGPAPVESAPTEPETDDTRAQPLPEETAPEETPEDTEISAIPERDPVGEMLAAMTVEEKTAQLFLVRYEAGIENAEFPDPGGYILFAFDFENKTADEVRAFTDALQGESATPLLIATDEEGGPVCRVSINENLRSKPFNSPRWLMSSGGTDAVAADTEEKSDLLLSLGINVNMAPVCDICDDPAAYMYRRSAGNLQDTCDYVCTTVGVMEEKGIGSVLKHFPGYGLNADTHTGAALDERPLEDFYAADFLPFEAGISAGADAVLVSHNVVAAMDTELPASLSPRVHEMLRQELGFQGVIVTDDLIMEAVSGLYGPGEAAVMAVQAGNDLLCSSDYETQYSAVLAAVESGDISAETIDCAVRRVLEWKISLGIIGG